MGNSKKFEINIKTIFDNGVSRMIGSLDKGIKRAKAFGNAMRRGMHSAPVRILRNALAGLVGTLAAGVMQAAKFNVEMARAWTMSSEGVGWFRKMRRDVRLLAGDLGVATEQLSGGLYQALSAGVPEDNVMEFLRTAAKIAVADGSDVATAVDGMTTVLNAFKIDAAEAGDVADQLFKTVANGKTTFGELAQSLSTVAPIAAANGIALDEVLAAVASLTKQGTPTAQAMTQIRSAIIGANKALGDGWTKSMSLQDGFKKIASESKGSQTQLMKMVGSIEAVQGVLGLTGINARMAAEDLEAMGNSAGRVDAAFQKVDQFRHWQKLWQNISGLVTRTAEEADSRLGPAVMRIVDDLARIQEDDDLWRGLGDTLDEAMEKVSNILEYIQAEGASGVGAVMDDLGLILIGHAKNGAEGAMEILAKWMPLLGLEFGKAARDAIANAVDVRSTALKQTRQEFGSPSGMPLGMLTELSGKFRDRLKQNEDKLRQERAISAGLDLSGEIGSGAGDADKALGYANLEKKGKAGKLIKAARQQRLDAAAEAEQLKQEMVEENARLAPLGGGRDKLSGWVNRQEQEGGAAGASSLDQREAAKAADMARSVADASEEENRLLARYLESTGKSLDSVLRHLVTQNQNMESVYQKLETLQNQIKNGRS